MKSNIESVINKVLENVLQARVFVIWTKLKLELKSGYLKLYLSSENININKSCCILDKRNKLLLIRWNWCLYPHLHGVYWQLTEWCKDVFRYNFRLSLTEAGRSRISPKRRNSRRFMKLYLLRLRRLTWRQTIDENHIATLILRISVNKRIQKGYKDWTSIDRVNLLIAEP